MAKRIVHIILKNRLQVFKVYVVVHLIQKNMKKMAVIVISNLFLMLNTCVLNIQRCKEYRRSQVELNHCPFDQQSIALPSELCNHHLEVSPHYIRRCYLTILNALKINNLKPYNPINP